MHSRSASSDPPQTVVLRIDSGSFNTGFQGALRVLEDGRQIGNDRPFSLPAAPQIPLLYSQWEQAYLSLGRLRKIDPPVDPTTRGIAIPAGQSTNHGLNNPVWAQKELADRLLAWFSSPEFMALEASVCRSVSLGNCESILIAIHSQTGSLDENRLLRKLPWHLWSLFTRLDNADAILMSDYAHPVPSFGSQIRVLLILGSDEGGLDLNQDLNSFKNLKKQGAKVLEEADFETFRERDAKGEFNDVKCLILPVLQQDLDTVHSLIYQNRWDIIFFAGHSFSDSSCQDGQLELRPGLCVPIEAFRTAFQKSVKRGLKLAIFNSCDGLGLAESLITFQVPNVIVMREPVPDRVAQKFLSYFLDEFLQGHPLTKAVLHARNQLHSLEYAMPPYPGASWLPILVKNPNQADLIWPTHQRFSMFKLRLPIAIFGGLIGLALAISSISKLLPKPPETIAQPPQSSPSSKPTPSPNPVQKVGHFKTIAEVEYPVGTFSYGGSTTWAMIETKVLPEIEKAAPQFKLKKLDAPPGRIRGSVVGLELLKQGEVAFAHVSRRVSLDSPAELKPHAVAYTFKAIAVHPGVALQDQGLTLRQIERICLGEIRNWAEVSGPDLPITVIDRMSQSGLKPSLGDACPANKIDGIQTTSDAIAKAKDTPGSFMITAATLVVPQCSLQILPVINDSGAIVYPFKRLSNLEGKDCRDFPRQIDIEVFRNGSYLGTELRDTLYVYLNENNHESLEAGGAYINALQSCEGQTLLEKAGYIRYAPNGGCPDAKTR
jgi:ABC-type phosphate transport system substrate-binding protein